jgi:uncharacterized membrane protein SpoIIM required for sporulation
MHESAFIQQNRGRWETFDEALAGTRTVEPDEMADLFVQVTDDLSYARTHFPESRTAGYLNALAGRVHLEIYRNKREERSRIITFWTTELPALMYRVRRPLLNAFIIFLIAGVIGAVSAANDETFVRLILGDAYVNMTLQNIEEGKPLGVYENMTEMNMFLAITFNNIRVSFFVFVAGLLFSVGTGYFLFSNGLMVGAFLMLFSQKNLLGHSLAVIFLHGTVELSSIVIAGAAGFVLGNSFLFPGTYSRLASFRMGALKGTKIVVGLIPFFVLAGFIESFITRYEYMPLTVKLVIIGLSAALMIFYFLLYPAQLHRHARSSH